MELVFDYFFHSTREGQRGAHWRRGTWLVGGEEQPRAPLTGRGAEEGKGPTLVRVPAARKTTRVAGPWGRRSGPPLARKTKRVASHEEDEERARNLTTRKGGACAA